MLKTLTWCGAAAMLALAVSCGGTASKPAHQQNVPTPIPTIPINTSPAVVSRADCADQMISWSSLGGSSAIQRIGNDAAQISKDAGSIGAIQADASGLRADATTALKLLPPTCIPNERTDWATAMHDFVHSATAILNGNLADSNAWTAAGSAALSRSTRDLSRWQAAS